MPYLPISSEEIAALRDNFSQSPSYIDVVRDLYKLLRWYFAPRMWEGYVFPQSFFDEFRRHFHVEAIELFYILAVAVLLTIIRYIFERFICKPFVKGLDLKTSIKRKFPESVWKTLLYTFTWIYCLYLVRYRYNYFDEPFTIWDDWYAGMFVPWDIRVLYFLQCGLYIHSIYATLYMDSKRKDYYIMFLHHGLTVALIFVSYGVRYHKIGLLVLFVHDATDICLESTKLMRYLTVRKDGREVRIWKLGSYVGFSVFTFSWFLFRLYWFPLRVLYSSGVVSLYRTLDKGSSLYFFFNCLLWILLGLNIYWLYFILKVLFKMLTSTLTNVRDSRDDDDTESSESEAGAKKKKKT